MNGTIDKIVVCQYLLIADLQRKDEVKRGEGLQGTQGYQDRGCYQCSGINNQCKAYSPKIKYKG